MEIEYFVKPDDWEASFEKMRELFHEFLEKEMGLTEDDMENISGFPRSIEGVKMAATLRETKDGDTKISVRAVPGYDAAAICAVFGGGGHKKAAGATLQAADIAAAEKMLTAEILKSIH